MHDPRTKTKGGGGLLEGMGVPGERRQRRKNWDNYNSIINKVYIF